jgi:hypothetical protein
MKLHSRLFGLAFFLAASQLAAGQGTLIAQHSGSANPTAEGFSLSGFGTPQCGPVANDQGLNAWSTVVSNSSAQYGEFLGSLTGQDWLLTVTLRVVTTNLGVGAFDVVINTGSSFFGLGFGSDAYGNQTTYGITNGGGSIYNTYELLYNSTSDTASLWINGVEQRSAIQGQYSSGQASLGWGGGSQGPASFQCNWNLVSLQITPEPSSAAVLLLGSGVSFYFRRKFFR